MAREQESRNQAADRRVLRASSDKERVNGIRPVGLVTPETDPDAGAKKTYVYDPHPVGPATDVGCGKAEHTSFELPTVSLHVHERIDPRTIIRGGQKAQRRDAAVGTLF